MRLISFALLGMTILGYAQGYMLEQNDNVPLDTNTQLFYALPGDTAACSAVYPSCKLNSEGGGGAASYVISGTDIGYSGSFEGGCINAFNVLPATDPLKLLLHDTAGTVPYQPSIWVKYASSNCYFGFLVNPTDTTMLPLPLANAGYVANIGTNFKTGGQSYWANGFFAPKAANIDVPPACGSYTCVNGVYKNNHASISCTIGTCSDDICCDIEYCSSHTCTTGEGPLPSPENIVCDVINGANQCTDATCCDVTYCDTHTCAVGVLESSASTIDCLLDNNGDSQCTDERCCDITYCDSHQCAADYILLNEPETIGCVNNVCNDLTCCMQDPWYTLSEDTSKTVDMSVNVWSLGDPQFTASIGSSNIISSEMWGYHDIAVNTRQKCVEWFNDLPYTDPRKSSMSDHTANAAPNYNPYIFVAYAHYYTNDPDQCLFGFLGDENDATNRPLNDVTLTDSYLSAEPLNPQNVFQNNVFASGDIAAYEISLYTGSWVTSAQPCSGYVDPFDNSMCGPGTEPTVDPTATYTGNDGQAACCVASNVNVQVGGTVPDGGTCSDDIDCVSNDCDSNSGVCVCIEVGQRVLMADGTHKNIEHLVPGDMLRTPDGTTAVRSTRRGGRHLSAVHDVSCNGKTGSITGNHAYHCEGEWRLPQETHEPRALTGTTEVVAIETDDYCNDRLILEGGLHVETWDGRGIDEWRPHTFENGRRLRCTLKGTWRDRVLKRVDSNQ